MPSTQSRDVIKRYGRGGAQNDAAGGVPDLDFGRPGRAAIGAVDNGLSERFYREPLCGIDAREVDAIVVDGHVKRIVQIKKEGRHSWRQWEGRAEVPRRPASLRGVARSPSGVRPCASNKLDYVPQATSAQSPQGRFPPARRLPHDGGMLVVFRS